MMMRWLACIGWLAMHWLMGSQLKPHLQGGGFYQSSQPTNQANQPTKPTNQPSQIK
jgi:hypothetical protein